MLHHFFMNGLPVVLLVMNYVGSVTIDNDILGDPDIECLDDQIRMLIRTRKPFAGRIYAKGKADNPTCSKDDYGIQKTKKPQMILKFGTCGMKSLRSVDPRGMYYGITVVVSFHTMFITMVDQAFHVKCFFEEASRGLTAELGVSMIATTEVEARHTIPGCTYSIHASSIEDMDAGKSAGPMIKYARVGDRVLHQWHCDDQMFGILINNCYVTDGFGKRADVVDSKGCSTDPILITGLRYSSDLQKAYAESMVFKFADRPGVWFFCQIQMCMKSSGMCDGLTPPTCAAHGGGHEMIYITDTERQNAMQRTKFPKKSTSKPFKSSTKKVVPYKKPENVQGYTAEVTEVIPDEYFDQANIKIETTPNPSYGFYVPTQEEVAGSEYPTPVKPLTIPPRKETVVTTVYEPEYAGEKQPKSKHEYPEEYEDITIPPNLNDLLANLPDDVNADSLQKMFRDSVEDRRTLMQGFDYLMNRMKAKGNNENQKETKLQQKHRKMNPGGKHNSVKGPWDFDRLADALPLTDNDDDDKNLDMTINQKTDHQSIYTQAATIAGQLIIYDLDEEPPTGYGSSRDSISESCAISRHGLLMLAACLGSLFALLFLVTLTMYLRLSKYSNFYKESALTLATSPNSVSSKQPTDGAIMKRIRSSCDQQRGIH